MACIKRLVPAGKIYWDSEADPGEVYFGDTPGAEISVDLKSVEVMSSDDPVSEMIDEIPISTVREMSFKCVNPSDAVISLFFEADAATVTQSSGSVTNEAITGAKQGRYYQLGKSTSNPTGVRGVSAATVNRADGVNAVAWAATTAKALNAFGKPTVANTYYYKATTAGTTSGTEPTWPTTVGATVTDGSVVWTCVAKIAATVTTDYTLDADLARLFIVEGGGVADDTDLLVDYTKAANSRTQHTATLDLSALLTGSLIFIANNTNGPNRDIRATRVLLRADGAAMVKRAGADAKITEFGLKAKFQADCDGVYSALYIDGRPV